jgi:2-keto-3-deoxy-L-rhamnonate aldolase RhmA
MRSFIFVCLVAVFPFVVPSHVTAQRQGNVLVDLWSQETPAFGVFVPNEAQRTGPPRGDAAAGGAPASRTTGGAGGAGGAGAPGAAGAGAAGAGAAARGQRPKPVYTEAGGQKLAANPLYDYVFLNLEGAYDSDAVTAIATGLRKGARDGARTALIVRVPAFHENPAEGRARLRDVFAAGAEGITFPHVETIDEAKQILAAAQAEKINVWSPDNPKGDKILMMMLEDPQAVAQAAAFADLKGYSVLACGIGSLRGALKGDAAGAEAGVQKVLAETKRRKLPNMLTATTADVEQRLKEGFLGILAQGQNPDEAITIGRKIAKR